MKNKTDELSIMLKSLYLDEGKYDYTDIFQRFSEFENDCLVERVDQFVADCFFPLEVYNEQWHTYSKDIRNLLDREEAKLSEMERYSDCSMRDYIKPDSVCAYRQRLDIFYAALCFYEKDVTRFQFFGRRMLEDSKDNIQACFVAPGDCARERVLPSGWQNPLVFFCSQRPSNNACLDYLPLLLEEYIGFLNTVSVNNAADTERWVLLHEEAEMRLERATEDVEERKRIWGD